MVATVKGKKGKKEKVDMLQSLQLARWKLVYEVVNTNVNAKGENGENGKDGLDRTNGEDTMIINKSENFTDPEH